MALAKVLYEVLGGGVCHFGLQYSEVFSLAPFDVSDRDAGTSILMGTMSLLRFYNFNLSRGSTRPTQFIPLRAPRDNSAWHGPEATPSTTPAQVVLPVELGTWT